MMICAPDINQRIEAPVELVNMICNIRRKIGENSILSLYDTVFFVTKLSRPKPTCAGLSV